MKITLDTIRQTLRCAFGQESFIASFITKVQPDKVCPTSSIDAKGVMRYNPQFVEKYVTDDKDVFSLIAHELMHPMFGHFIHQSGQLENISADMIVNAAISLVLSHGSGNGSLFRKFYQPIGLEGLLRPGSQMYQSRYSRLYDTFYQGHGSGHKLSTGEVIQALKVLTPTHEIPRLVLLGSHGKTGTGTSETTEGSGDVPVPAFRPDVLGHIAQDLQRAAENPGGIGAAYGESLYEYFIDVLKTHLSIKNVLLQKFSTRQKVDRFKQVVQRPRIGMSPIPLHPSKRDFVLLAAGIPPFHYHNRVTRQGSEDRGLAVYLDVSGSVNQHLPEIIGLLRSFKNDLKTVFLFINKVIEVPFRTLLKGHVQTTYGTDFDCIAEHVLANRFDKAVILTDGYASMKLENLEELKRCKLRALTVLFGGKQDCPEFGPFGDVIILEEVTA